MDDEFEVPNVNFVSCIKIVKQGASKTNPVQIQLTRKELEDLNKTLGRRLNVDGNEDESDGEENEVENGGDDEYNLEHYSDEEELALKVNDVAVYDESDPYKSAYMDLPDSEEEDDVIKSNDNLILVGHVERSTGILEVYGTLECLNVYNDREGSFYVHHDYLLSNLPLALEWLNYDPGNPSVAGNLCAVGSISPIIEVWDLDIVNCVEPAFKLGRKGSRRRGRARLGHKNAVLDLSWNKHFHHILASGSADDTIILWDLDKGEPDTSLTSFQDKVQSLIWHPFEGQTLLAGSADKTCKVFDCRLSDSFKSWTVEGEVERVIWNHFNPFEFFASDDRGFVYGFDCRNEGELWKISAHSKEVTGLSLSSRCPGLLSTASQDKSLKIWDVLSGKPEAVAVKDLKIGCVQCLEFAPDLPYLLATGGDKKSKNLKVLNAMEMKEVQERFRGRSLTPSQPSTTENQSSEVANSVEEEAMEGDDDEDEDEEINT